ncbi:hypothetical protein [Endozoicomonas sp. Mp262]|uniref:hypothetical protein n=1 Tax=Endozoicomonas sp. Mp262 TaxID=2919499 RepID=UPI0021E0BCCA
MPRPLLIFFLLWTTLATAESNVSLSPEQIIKQELLLNSLIQDIHLLQLNFQNQETKERLQDTVTQLDKHLTGLPKTHHNHETRQLLLITHSLWPVISQHSRWLAKLPAKQEAPKLNTLIKALAKLDRQLQILRQTILAANPKASQQLRFLEQALLMQKMSREYLFLTSSSQQALSKARQQQLQAMAKQFDQRMGKIYQEFKAHPHAKAPLRQASMTWNFISKSIGQYPRRPVPSTVARYSSQIVDQLASIHNMF